MPILPLPLPTKGETMYDLTRPLPDAPDTDNYPNTKEGADQWQADYRAWSAAVSARADLLDHFRSSPPVDAEDWSDLRLQCVCESDIDPICPECYRPLHRAR